MPKESNVTDSLEAFLSEANVAVLATVDAKSRPHAAPVWYLYEDGEFVISTGAGSQKHRNVERNPEVTLVIEKRTLPYLAVMARGRAELGPGPSEDWRLKLATHYIGDERGRRYVERTAGGQSVTLRLRPTKIIEYNGRAGRD
jgi:PPOX class probable F420-dependent enzyme